MCIFMGIELGNSEVIQAPYNHKISAVIQVSYNLNCMKNISNYYVNFYEDTNILMPIFDKRNLSLDCSYELSVCLVILLYTVRHMERISHCCTTGSIGHRSATCIQTQYLEQKFNPKWIFLKNLLPNHSQYKIEQPHQTSHIFSVVFIINSIS